MAVTIGIGAATRAWERRVDRLAGLPPAPVRLAPYTPPAPTRGLPPGHRLHDRSRPDGGGSGDPVTAAFERGVAAYNADDADAAADAFEEAVRLAPEASEAHINLGLVYLRLQRPDDAMRELVMGASLAKGQEAR